MTAALDVLQSEQSGIIRGSTLWQLYETEIKKVNAQLDVLEGTLPVVATEMKVVGAASSTSIGGIGKGLTGMLSGVRQLAYILPGIGMAGIFNLAFEAIQKAAEELDIFNNQAKELSDANDKAIESFSEQANKVAILVSQLKNENTEHSQKVKIIKQLQDAAPAYFSNLKLEGDTVVNLTDDYANFGRAIILVARIKGASDLNQKNVTAQIKEQLHTSEALLNLEKNKTTLQELGVHIGTERLLILEDELEAQTKLAHESKPLLDIIIQAQKELDALGGNPFGTPEKIKENVKKALDYISQQIRDTHIAPIPVNFTFVPPDIGNLQGSVKGFQTMDDFIKKLQDAQALKKFNQQLEATKEIASEIAKIFSDMFVQLITKGKISFQQLGQEVARFIGKLIEAVIQTIVLDALLSAIGIGTGNVSQIGRALGSFSFTPHAEGGIFTQPTLLGNHLFGESGPEALIPLSRMNEMSSNMGGGNLNITGELRMHGTDMVLVLNKSNVRLNRNYGGNFN